MVRPTFIALIATLLLVGGICWHLGGTVTKNVVIEKRKTEVLDWISSQDGLVDLMKTKYAVILTTNTGIPGSIRVVTPAGRGELTAQEIEGIRTELYLRRCPYGITHIDGDIQRHGR